MANSPDIKKPKGRAEVAYEYCKSCSLCVAACPKKALRISDGINPKGYRPSEQVGEDCTACGICAMTCPDAAITIYRVAGDES